MSTQVERRCLNGAANDERMDFFKQFMGFEHNKYPSEILDMFIKIMKSKSRSSESV